MSPPPLSALNWRERYFLEFARRDISERGCTVLTIFGTELTISPGLHADLIAGVLADYVRQRLMSADALVLPDQLEADHV